MRNFLRGLCGGARKPSEETVEISDGDEDAAKVWQDPVGKFPAPGKESRMQGSLPAAFAEKPNWRRKSDGLNLKAGEQEHETPPVIALGDDYISDTEKDIVDRLRAKNRKKPTDLSKQDSLSMRAMVSSLDNHRPYDGGFGMPAQDNTSLCSVSSGGSISIRIAESRRCNVAIQAGSALGIDSSIVKTAVQADAKNKEKRKNLTEIEQMEPRSPGRAGSLTLINAHAILRKPTWSQQNKISKQEPPKPPKSLAPLKNDKPKLFLIPETKLQPKLKPLSLGPDGKHPAQKLRTADGIATPLKAKDIFKMEQRQKIQKRCRLKQMLNDQSFEDPHRASLHDRISMSGETRDKPIQDRPLNNRLEFLKSYDANVCPNDVYRGMPSTTTTGAVHNTSGNSLIRYGNGLSPLAGGSTPSVRDELSSTDTMSGSLKPTKLQQMTKQQMVNNAQDRRVSLNNSIDQLIKELDVASEKKLCGASSSNNNYNCQSVPDNNNGKLNLDSFKEESGVEIDQDILYDEKDIMLMDDIERMLAV